MADINQLVTEALSGRQKRALTAGAIGAGVGAVSSFGLGKYLDHNNTSQVLGHMTIGATALALAARQLYDMKKEKQSKPSVVKYFKKKSSTGRI